MTHQTKRVPCPKCQAPLNAHTNVTEGTIASPRAGDLSVCGYCAIMLRYVDDEGTVSILSSADYADLDPETQTDLARAVHAIRSMHGMEPEA